MTEPARRIANRERLIFALDVPDLKGAKELVTRLGDSVVFYKIGLELATSRHYFELLDWLIGARQESLHRSEALRYSRHGHRGRAAAERLRRVVPDRARRSRDHGSGRARERRAAQDPRRHRARRALHRAISPRWASGSQRRGARAQARAASRGRGLRRRHRVRARGGAAARGLGCATADRDARHPAAPTARGNDAANGASSRRRSRSAPAPTTSSSAGRFATLPIRI